MMHHYVYMTIDTKSNKFYVGRHSTKNLLDGYHGSGKWIKSIKDKSRLNTIIITYCDDIEKLKIVEEFSIRAAMTIPGCMNFNNSSCGFSSGVLNPSCSIEGRTRLSEKSWMKTDAGRKYASEHNPSKMSHVKDLRSEQLKSQWKDDNYRQHMIDNHWTKNNKEFSDYMRENNPSHRPDVVEKLKESSLDYYNRDDNHPFKRQELREKSITALRNSEKNKNKFKDPLVLAKLKVPKKKIKCNKCGKECAAHIISRYHNDKCKNITDL